ncbi:MAG TPA: NAD-dependent DNA ligase LigA [Candidatus Paceibacterota bacterium]|nr:NAD-dependent DNA ligase LigA [Candidatus Pacearchaeota archaeon]HRZ50871.1 NAD-dependent DNA ligase LigA [Candidatus Paceibacterota bacterium]HSA36592.1 NAD-dependent DNA ligase LigA [Candidatus Paceibacterota bacterium]
MTKKEAKTRIGKLKTLINRYRYAYHVMDRQEISDEALDSLKKEIYDLELRYPEFITPDSPTQRVAGAPLKNFVKFAHSEPMNSLNDAFSAADMADWQARFSKLLDQRDLGSVDFYCEPKLDGLAVELIYRDGFFSVGATRGDGRIGENVTQNLKTIEAIPLKLKDPDKVYSDLKKEGLGKVAERFSKKGMPDIEVRGEVVIAKKEFAKVNNEQLKKGLPLFANPRNLAAGSIRQLDPQVAASRHLDSNCYALVSDLGQATHYEEHRILEILGFKTNNKYSKYCRNLDEVFNFHGYWYKNREKLPYEIDGIVVRINSNAIFKKLGTVGKAPRGAIAYKFPLKQTTTVVEDILVQVGRTGALTPVAVLKPVEVGGVVITRATLHNEDEIKRLGLMIGDTVVVGRAGDVIPDIIKVLPELRSNDAKKFLMPRSCPVCGAKVAKPDGEVVWRCLNPECFAVQERYFSYFFSDKGFDVQGLGPKIIEKLMEEGLMRDPADLFLLKEGDLAPLQRFAEKSAKKLVESVQAKKIITLPRFLNALGIRQVGEETSLALARRFGGITEIKKASLEELQNVEDIGPKVAESIYGWFREKKNLTFIAKLQEIGIRIEAAKIARNPKIGGKAFVFTGSLASLERQKAKESVRARGGSVSESVSKKTDYVVAGENPGSKYDKAKKLGVKTIDEKEFLKLLQ